MPCKLNIGDIIKCQAFGDRMSDDAGGYDLICGDDREKGKLVTSEKNELLQIEDYDAAFYAAKRGNLHSLYVVREIDNPKDRNLVQWWVITFDEMAQYASWNFRPGGKNMAGGESAVVRIPKVEFRPLTPDLLATL